MEEEEEEEEEAGRESGGERRREGCCHGNDVLLIPLWGELVFVFVSCVSVCVCLTSV